MYALAWKNRVKRALLLNDKDTLEFISEWDKTTRGNYPISKALTLLGPYIEHWFKMIKRIDYPKDSQYLTLLSYLKVSSDDTLFIKWRSSVKDLKSELILIAANLLVKKYKAPINSQSISNMQYAFSFLFTGYLYVYIRNSLLRLSTDTSISDNDIIYTMLEPEYFLLDEYLKTTWDFYMLYLLSADNTFADVNTLLKLPKNNINYHEVPKWQKMKVWHQ